MPIRHRRFAFALVSLFGLTGVAQAQPPWEQQRHDEMRDREEYREDRIRHEQREAWEREAREREWRHRHEEEMRAEERERFRHEDGRPDRPEFNR